MLLRMGDEFSMTTTTTTFPCNRIVLHLLFSFAARFNEITSSIEQHEVTLDAKLAVLKSTRYMYITISIYGLKRNLLLITHYVCFLPFCLGKSCSGNDFRNKLLLFFRLRFTHF